MKRLVEYDSDFEQFMKKDEIAGRLSALENEKEIGNLSNDVFGLIGECNSIGSSNPAKEIFKITNNMFKRISDVDTPVITKDDFGNFIDALYEIVYEGSGGLSRVPASVKKDESIVFTIKFVRADMRHDLDHGDAKEVAKKKERLAEIYKAYANMTSLDAV